MKAALILNPTAGKAKRLGANKRIVRALLQHGIPCDIFLTRKTGDGIVLARRAAESGHDLVIAGGGDGTVNEVANGIVGTGVTLGILPLGTVNVLARELGIPLNYRKAIRVFAEGSVKRIDLGCANGRYFTLMAGFGFDAKVVANVLKPIKDWIGASAYVFEALETLADYQATDVTIRMPDGAYSTKAFLIIVANVSTYTYNLKITPYAAPDDGMLDICVFECPLMDKIGFMQQVVEVFMNRHLYHKAVRYFRTTSVTIDSEPEIMVQLDGDAFGTTPVEIRIAHRILPVMVPAGEPVISDQ